VVGINWKKRIVDPAVPILGKSKATAFATLRIKRLASKLSVVFTNHRDSC
jgi:hypothetical protein